MEAKIEEIVDDTWLSICRCLGNANAQNTIDRIKSYFLEANQEILEHLSDIKQAYELWSDDFSKIQYRNFLTYQLVSKINRNLAVTLNNNLTPAVFNKVACNLDKIAAKKGLTLPKINCPLVTQFGFEQYIYPQHVELNKGDVFIDCGACLGDTSIWASQKGATVYAFEPIDYVFDSLQYFLDLNGYQDVKCFNLGVSSKSEELTFKASKEFVGCAFLDQGIKHSHFQSEYLESRPHVTEDVVVKCVRLDDFFAEQGIAATFIKMDIEGAELEALHGASESIKQCKPKLAICLYHSDSDLWTIPLYLHSLVPEYKFYCRQNAVETEFVMYAAIE